jgi:hypothetical protein
MNRKLEQLKSKIEKYYYAHGQHLILETMEVMSNDDNDCSFTVYLANSEIFLFDVYNYKGFEDLEAVHKSYFKKDRYRWFNTLDVVSTANKPIYIDRLFTLKTLKPITKENIIQCTNYFIHEILGMMLIFNIKFAEDKIEKEPIEGKQQLIKGLNEY